MKLAVDAMGGDDAPRAVVEGVELARDVRDDIEFILFGDEAQVRPLLKNDHHIKIVQADEVIGMDEEPVRAVKKKRKSSLVLAAKAVKNGDADALVSIGSSGALLVSSLLLVGRIRGVDRPGFTATLPVINDDRGFTMVDAGANADAKVQNIVQYSLLAKYYVENVRGINNPRIGLINNGTEADKGDMIHRKMHDALQELGDKGQINFIGNVESRDLLNGVTDIAVTDGFTGNAVLKSIEGTASSIISMLKSGIKQGGIGSKLGALLLKGTLKKIAKKMDYKKQGGAVLLGLKAPVIKGHGNSDAETMKYCLTNAADVVKSGYVKAITDHFNEHEINPTDEVIKSE
ncbi:phosphate acyltransferase PlsX [Fructilactobacillus vespulae]|uniref:phosphate acyltransferase PlsX n=1 Tax=Fructilactobacillus vespulae TaxID=1249630 RepID=UPI0039B4CA8E